MIDRSAVDRVLAANLYLVLGTADGDGRPWVSPVFFAPYDPHGLCWVSSPDSRHSRNIAARDAVAITVFDSSVAVGQAEAAYFDAHAAPAPGNDVEEALRCLNSRLPQQKSLSRDDLQPHGPLVVYLADVQHSYVLVRGGTAEYGNPIDMTVEV
jgi:hypothetical protein